MRFTCYHDWNQLPQNAETLFTAGTKESVFYSRQWLENISNSTINSDKQLTLACVVSEDELLAVLPLVIHSESICKSLIHNYSSLYSVLIVEENRQEILNCLVDGLKHVSCKQLRLEPFADNDMDMNDLQLVMSSIGYECHRYFRFYNWIHRCRGESFDAYMASRPSRVRNTIARKGRKLEREHGYEFRMYIQDDIDQALEDFNSVYTSSWKANEQFSDVVEGIVVNMSKPGWLRLGVLYIAGQAAAAQIWFVVHGRASIFRLAYDEAWKHYSPGSILISHMMKHVLDVDRVKEIDFLTGNDAYKQDWMSERRERWGMRCGLPDQPRKVFSSSIKRFKNKLKLGSRC